MYHNESYILLLLQLHDVYSSHPALIESSRSCFFWKRVCLGTIVIENEMFLTVNSSTRRQPWTALLSLSQRTVWFPPGSPNLFIYLRANPRGFWDTVTPLWTLITLVPVCLYASIASPSCSPELTSPISPALHSSGRISTPTVRSSHERKRFPGLYARPIDYMELGTCAFLSVYHPHWLLEESMSQWVNDEK